MGKGAQKGMTGVLTLGRHRVPKAERPKRSPQASGVRDDQQGSHRLCQSSGGDGLSVEEDVLDQKRRASSGS